jgi:hypothetical protein
MVSLRIDDALRKRLAEAARRRATNSSELARRAIESWLDHEEGRVRQSPAESIGELLGSVAGGQRDRATSDRFLGGRGAARRPPRPRALEGRKKK